MCSFVHNGLSGSHRPNSTWHWFNASRSKSIHYFYPRAAPELCLVCLVGVPRDEPNKACGSSFLTHSRVRKYVGFRNAPAFWRMRLRVRYFLPPA